MPANTTFFYQTISPAARWSITFVVMAATLMEMIDTTIVNVALPHMRGALSASSDEITWTITSYLVASAIFMPLTGYLSDTLGRKNFLFICIAGFTLSSAFCGAATTLPELVFFRFLQGALGASLVPLSQAILADIFPPEDRPKAMAIWGIGVMIGPILGPTLGGYLTDFTSWRWAFYINIPVGLFTLLIFDVMPNSPRKERTMDWPGLLLISFAIGGLQFVLDRGNQVDWFDSSLICWVSYFVVTAFLGFCLHSAKKTQKNVFNLQVFFDRNFAISSILLAVFCLGLYGMMVTQPLMMEGLLNYPALNTGLMMAPRGISGMISMFIVSKLITKIDSRLLILCGLILSISGLFISTHYSLTNISYFWLIWPMILQGLGLGLVFVPLSTIAYSTLPQELRTEAAGLFSLLRTIGGSIGISIAITLYTRNSQLFWNQLGEFIKPYHLPLHQYLQPLHLAPTNITASLLLGNELGRQSAMLAFINVFAAIMWCFILMIPLVALLKKK